MSTKRLQKKKAAMQAKKEQQLKKNTLAAKIETSKTEPLKVGTSKTEPVKVTTAKTEPAKVTTSKTEPLKVETSKEDTAYDALYEKRLNHYYNDLKWLYCELFRNHPEVSGTFSSLTKKMKEIYRERSLSMKEADQNRTGKSNYFQNRTSES